MATSNMTCEGATSAIKAYMSVSENDPKGGINRTVRIKIWVNVEDGYGSTYTRSFKYSVNGGSETNTTIGANSVYIFNSDVDISVPYNKSTASVSISYTASMYSDTKGSWRTISGTMTTISGLTVDRGSVVIGAVQDTTFGGCCSVSWTPPSSTVYNKLIFSMGRWSATTNLFCPGVTSTYTYDSYQIPYEAAEQIPDSDYGVMDVELFSYSDSRGSNQIGSSSRSSFRVTLPDSIKPTISSYGATKDNSGNATINGWGLAIAGYTRVKLFAVASGAYGSTITKFTITGGYSETVNGDTLNYTGGVIQSSGSKTFTITCTDTRGRTSTQVTTNAISFLSYTPPKISQMTASKEDSGNASISSIFSYDSINGNNSAVAKLSYRPVGSTTWYEHSGIVSNNTKFITNITPTDEQSYYFRLTVTDSVGSIVEKEAFLSTIKVLMDFKKDGDGLGIGKICESSGLEVMMNTTFFGDVNIGTKTLSQFIQSIFKFLPSDMYGDDHTTVTDVGEGRIYFEKVST